MFSFKHLHKQIKTVPKKRNTGFTLIEIVIAVSIFSLAVGTASSIFVYAISSQRKALSAQSLLDQISYDLEHMSRSLRMAKKQRASMPPCLSANGINYDLYPGGDGIRFIDYTGECQEFFLDNGQLKKKIAAGTPSEQIFDLTDTIIHVNALNFNLEGASQYDSFQPKVTLLLDLSPGGTESGEQFRLRLQTTVSQRNLDIQVQ